MKKNAKKISVIAALLLVLLVVGIAVFLLGNPVLYAVSKSSAQDYIDQHYWDSDYIITDMIYAPKRGSYNAVISSPSSIDTKFSLVMNRFGGIEQNTYDLTVANGFNTGMRLNYEYRELVEKIIFSDDFPFDVNPNSYGRLAFHSDESPTFDFSVSTGSLIKDKILSQKELNDVASRCGEIYLTINTQQFNEQTANDVALLIKNLCLKDDVTFYILTLTLEAQNGGETTVAQYNFLYDDIG